MPGHTKERITQVTDLEAEENPVDMSDVHAVDSMTVLGTRSLEKERRVRECMALMKAARYAVGGDSHEELAAKWGISVSRAAEVVGEAWRRVQTQVLDRNGQQVYALERLRGIAESSLDEADTAPAKERNFSRKVAVSALGEILRFTSGLGAVPVEWETLSVEEKWARVDEAQRKVDAARAMLPPRRVDAEVMNKQMAEIERERENKRQ